MTNVQELSAAELKKLLAEKEKEEKELAQARKQEYEDKREALVKALFSNAVSLHQDLKEFKSEAFNRLEEFREIAKEYADIRSTSKGGYSLRSKDGQYLVRLDRNVDYEYDERADQAILLISEFLEDTVKKRDKQTFRAISTLLAKNKSGVLNPAKIASLLQIRDNWSDERWVKALDLLVESYREREVSYSISFYKKDELGKDQWLSLNFSTL